MCYSKRAEKQNALGPDWRFCEGKTSTGACLTLSAPYLGAFMSEIANCDVAFIVDSTGSMGTLIASAQRDMVSMVTSLSKESSINTRFAVVEYRDHAGPRQSSSFVTREYDFTDKPEKAQLYINRLRADEGGDTPEAVFDGLASAADKLSWDKHARRIGILLGDAAYHGYGGSGDIFPKGCPCGDTVESSTAKLENKNVTLYTIGLTYGLQPYFGPLAAYTGGLFVQSDAVKAFQAIQVLLKKEFSNIAFDTQVLNAWAKTNDFDEIATSLKVSRELVAESVCRLNSRNLLD